MCYPLIVPLKGAWSESNTPGLLGTKYVSGEYEITSHVHIQMVIFQREEKVLVYLLSREALTGFYQAQNSRREEKGFACVCECKNLSALYTLQALHESMFVVISRKSIVPLETRPKFVRFLIENNKPDRLLVAPIPHFAPQVEKSP